MHLDIPPLFCPIEARIHPEAESIDAGAADWWMHGRHTEDVTLLHRTAATRSGIYLARCLPTAPGDRVESMARWCYASFAFDDLYCDRGPLSTDPCSFLPLSARTAAAIETMDPAVADGNRIVLALQDATRRFATHATPAQLARWTQAHRLWMTGTAEQIAYRARSLTPDPDSYLITRLKSVAADCGWAGVEMCLGPDLAERSAPMVRALTGLASLVTAIDNDLFSAAAEAEAGPDARDPNIVDVLCSAHTAPPDPGQARAAAIALRDRALVRFLHLRRPASKHYGCDLNRYLDALGQTIRANLDFSLDMLSARYAARGLRTPDDRTALFTDSPTDDSPVPPPIPCIAWLWSDDLPW